jgi:hypothetical protein
MPQTTGTAEGVLAKVIDIATARNEERDWLLRRLDGAYAERTLLILALCALFPSGTKKAPVRGMPREFDNAVYVDTPAGQLSWHIHEDDFAAFAHLPAYAGEWDGHSTEEKYRRLLDPAFAETEETKALRFYADGFEMAGQDDNVSPEPTDALCEDAGRMAFKAIVHRLRYRPEPQNIGLDQEAAAPMPAR